MMKMRTEERDNVVIKEKNIFLNAKRNKNF